MKEAYKILSGVQMTPLLAQIFTGHGGFAQYLYRLKLNNSPYWVCALDKVQDLLHVLEECPIFLKERVETKAGPCMATPPQLKCMQLTCATDAPPIKCSGSGASDTVASQPSSCKARLNKV
ncbi:hypothetical protein EVAR_6772_1 [Eumeta japonica]|uniref:Retrovirus-related Pol polyprotein from type-1 retrotransposable element R1 n=1 Tax=Eumeta variegata TaxID=151549 RepID=A0A4C1V5X8_EUMVA|nr:hypothetical protein EVAR_6772_1 [Eumeta japonica]